MFLKEFKPTTLALSLSLLFSAPTFAQQQPSGAGAAKGAAVGGVTAGTIAAAVAVVAIAAALSGGSSGATAPSGGQQTLNDINAINTGSVSGLKNANDALAALGTLPSSTLLTNATEALAAAERARLQSVQASAELEAGLKVPGLRLVSEFCGGKNVCDAGDIIRLRFVAAEKSKLAVEASYFAISQLLILRNSLTLTPAQAASFDGLIQAAQADTDANKLVSDRLIAAYNLARGTSGTIMVGISGTAGTIGPSGSTFSN